tara:strand:+ start:751 stop:1017 length:267 start_codon:yes stop_codon:yes gene_type:complete
MTPIKELSVAIMDADITELKTIQDLLQMRRDQLCQNNMDMFSVGDKVSFMHKNIKVLGTVRKKNIKRIVVDTAGGGWNIPATLLSPEE